MTTNDGSTYAIDFTRETGPLDEVENDPALPTSLRDLAKKRREQHFAMWSTVNDLDSVRGGTELHRAFEGTLQAWAAPALNALRIVLAERGVRRIGLNDDPSRAVEENPGSKAESDAAQALRTSTDEMRGRCDALALLAQVLRK